MSRIVLGEALKALQTRNDALIGAYREGARSLPPGPVANLATSMAEQRKDMAKTLATLSASPVCRAEIELDSDARIPGSLAPLGSRDAAGVLSFMKESEDSDFELFTDLAGSAVAVSAQAAELLASVASEAKKRASWAKDHLELMGLSKP
jgi:hypothetical protein